MISRLTVVFSLVILLVTGISEAASESCTLANNAAELSFQCFESAIITCVQGDLVDSVVTAAGSGNLLLNPIFYVAGGSTTCTLKSENSESSEITLNAPVLNACHFQEPCVFCWSNWLTWNCYSTVQKVLALTGLVLAVLCGLSMVQKAAEGLFSLVKMATMPIWGPCYVIYCCRRRRATAKLQRSVHSAADYLFFFLQTKTSSAKAKDEEAMLPLTAN